MNAQSRAIEELEQLKAAIEGRLGGREFDGVREGLCSILSEEFGKATAKHYKDAFFIGQGLRHLLT